MAVKAPRVKSRAPRHSLRLGPDNWDGAPAYRPTVDKGPKKYAGKRRGSPTSPPTPAAPEAPRSRPRERSAAGGRKRTPLDNRPYEQNAPASPRARFGKSSPMQRVEERERLIRGHAQPRPRPKPGPSGKGARTQLAERAQVKPGTPHRQSGYQAHDGRFGAKTGRPDSRLPAVQARHENPPAKRGVKHTLFGGFFAGRGRGEG